MRYKDVELLHDVRLAPLHDVRLVPLHDVRLVPLHVRLVSLRHVGDVKDTTEK